MEFEVKEQFIFGNVLIFQQEILVELKVKLLIEVIFVILKEEKFLEKVFVFKEEVFISKFK